MSAMSELHADLARARPVAGPLTMPLKDAERLAEALRKITEAAARAEAAPDLDAARKALNAVWWATHDAADLINAIDKQTRDAALAKLEQAA